MASPAYVAPPPDPEPDPPPVELEAEFVAAVADYCARQHPRYEYAEYLP
jgi:hypothetical protein